jgi:hypothetical protein
MNNSGTIPLAEKLCHYSAIVILQALIPYNTSVPYSTESSASVERFFPLGNDIFIAT